MMEVHPFSPFVPNNAKYLMLGSFVAVKRDTDHLYDWFYGSSRNQLWSILESVYNVKLIDRKSKQKLLRNLSIAITDIIYQCERKNASSLDVNLTNITYNNSIISNILKENSIEKIFFTSRFVESGFKRHFKDLIKKYPNTKLITLPSPSPRYATLTKIEKIKKYRALLPHRKNPIS